MLDTTYKTREIKLLRRTRMWRVKRLTFALILTAMAGMARTADGAAPPEEKRSPSRPKPDVSAKYAEHPANAFDLWLAKSDKPTPLFVFIHGGGFRAGTKNDYDLALLKRCLKDGISFGAIEYRLSGVAKYPAQMHDCARAIQFIRHNAAKWNLDPKRIASTGGSAGAGIS